MSSGYLAPAYPRQGDNRREEREGLASASGAMEYGDHHKLFFESSGDGLLLAGVDGDVLDANPRACRILRRTREEVTAAGGDAVFDPTDSRLEPAREEQRSTGSFDGELRLLRRNETSFPAEVSIFVYRDEGGNDLSGVIFRDITERKRAEEGIRRLNEILERRVVERTARLEAVVRELETSQRMLRESEELFRTTFEQAAVGMAHVGPDGRFLRVNQKLCEIVDYTREELLQRGFQDITHSDDLDNDLEHLDRMLSGETNMYSVEKRYIKKDHSQVWINLTVALVREPSGDSGYFISVVKDITGRKQAELLLRSLSPREVDILRLLALGRTNQEISRDLRFSVSTVKNHVRNIIARLGVSDRTQAAVRAVELGLVNPEQ